MTGDINYFDEIVKSAKKGNTLQQTADILKCNKRTVQRFCEAKGTKYSILKIKKRLITKGDNSKSGGKKGSLPNTQKKNSEETGENYTGEIPNIDEDFYQTYLKEVIKSYPPSIKILTEVRNYLDKKQELKPAAQSALEMTPEQIQALSGQLEEVH